jgi:hypothetical protein
MATRDKDGAPLHHLAELRDAFDALSVSHGRWSH